MAIAAVASCAVLLGACGGSGGSKSATATTTATATIATTQTSSTAQSPPGSTETSPGIVRASSGGVTATMHAATHHPHVGHWPVQFVVTHEGRPVKAEVRYEYLFGGQVVAHRSHYKFTGSFHDVFTWPSSAVGYPLTFRAVIIAGGATLNLDYAVQVVG